MLSTDTIAATRGHRSCDNFLLSRWQFSRKSITSLVLRGAVPISSETDHNPPVEAVSESEAKRRSLSDCDLRVIGMARDRESEAKGRLAHGEAGMGPGRRGRRLRPFPSVHSDPERRFTALRRLRWILSHRFAGATRCDARNE
jgi:hypothetical protein